MNTGMLVVYKSVTGFTEMYAQRIAAELDCAAVALRALRPEMLSACDTLIFGGRLHVGRVDGLKALRGKLERAGEKRLILFATGAMPESARETIEAAWRANLSEDELARVPHFYLPGGLRQDRLPMTDRLMIRAYASMLARQKDKSAEDEQAARLMTSSYDNSDPAAIAPLVACARETAE